MAGADRLIAVWCPSLLREGERGEEARRFLRVLQAAESLCPWVEAVRLGVCVLPARGPSRFFGGEAAVVRRLAEVVGETVAGSPVGVEAGRADPVCVGVADGVFAAVLAARSRVVVPRDGTAAFLAPWSVAVLQRPELAVTLQRLGVHTLGQFAALPARHVLARFGGDAASCHRAARGIDGELPGLRDPWIDRRLRAARGDPGGGPRQPGFFGGTSATDGRAAASFSRVQARLGAEAVLVGRLQGGRTPAERARLVPWGSQGADAVTLSGPVPAGTDADQGGPWPGRLPAPSPAEVLRTPVPVEMVDADTRPVQVGGRALLGAEPSRISIGGGPWQEVRAWAGPWPAADRWWATRRRRARLQVLTGSEVAVLLSVERGRWWLEAVYD